MVRRAVVAYGRMNPPTIGHLRLVERMNEVAQSLNIADQRLYLSQAYDGAKELPKGAQIKNPLPHFQKLKYVKDAFGHMVDVQDEVFSGVFECLELVNKTVDEIWLVGDSDFISIDFEKYNGMNYSFKAIHKVLSGERVDAGVADSLEAVSATKVRELVKSGQYNKFTDFAATRNLTSHMWSELRRQMNCI